MSMTIGGYDTNVEANQESLRKVTIQRTATIDALHVSNINSEYIDLVNNPSTYWSITREDGQPDSETIQLQNGLRYIRYFNYNAQGILVNRSNWQLTLGGGDE